MKKKETMKNIHGIAKTLFTEKGYDNVTIQDICEAARITRPTFYSYGLSKEELFCESCRLPFDWEQWNLSQIQPLESVILGVWLVCQGIYSLSSEEMKSYLKLHVQHNTLDNTYVPSFRSRLEQLIAQAQQDGTISNKATPKFLADMLCLYLLGVSENYAAEKTKQTQEQNEAACRAILWQNETGVYEEFSA